ncbi:MAG: KOW motif-containing protein, partial [Clostridia bacterium]|nr:KOW motif-containing protein [Clostridia bacterium]
YKMSEYLLSETSVVGSGDSAVVMYTDKDGNAKPVPLSDEEVVAMGVERIPIVLNIEVGEDVRVVSGPLENFIGRVEAIDVERQKVKLTVSMFGRETPVELDFVQVQKI